jgi:hypothetical protein
MDFQRLVILAENFKILGLTGGKTSLEESKMEPLKKKKNVQHPISE